MRKGYIDTHGVPHTDPGPRERDKTSENRVVNHSPSWYDHGWPAGRTALGAPSDFVRGLFVKRFRTHESNITAAEILRMSFSRS